MHARKAWLKGLSPRENRDIPPLDYDVVFRLKAAHPRLPIVLNGGIATVEAAREHLARLDGVMMGRAAYQEPWRLLDGRSAAVRRGGAVCLARRTRRGRCMPYIERELARGTRLHAITRHLHGLFHARAGRARLPPASGDRRRSSPAHAPTVLAEALALVVDSPAELAHTAAA